MKGTASVNAGAGSASSESPAGGSAGMPIRGAASRRWQAARRFARTQPLGLAGLFILAGIAFVALFASAISPGKPDAFYGDAVLAGPSAAHPFGTDGLGQDLMSRIFQGARITLWISGGAVVAGLGAGTILGCVSGYWSNFASASIDRVMDALMAFPTMIVALVVVSIFGVSTNVTIAAIAIGMVPGTTRIVRSAVIGVRGEAYVEAARTLGASDARVIARHVLPNILPVVIVAATVGLGSAILAESALSFLGLGTPPTNPSWGQMLSGDARRYMQSAPWLAIFPGLALGLTVFAVNVLGDALRDVLDPRLRAR